MEVRTRAAPVDVQVLDGADLHDVADHGPLEDIVELVESAAAGPILKWIVRANGELPVRACSGRGVAVG
jgi:hypothetical protein